MALSYEPTCKRVFQSEFCVEGCAKIWERAKFIYIPLSSLLSKLACVNPILSHFTLVMHYIRSLSA